MQEAMAAGRGIASGGQPSSAITTHARAAGSYVSRAVRTRGDGHTVTISSLKNKAAATCPATSRRCAVAVMEGRRGWKA